MKIELFGKFQDFTFWRIYSHLSAIFETSAYIIWNNNIIKTLGI